MKIPADTIERFCTQYKVEGKEREVVYRLINDGIINPVKLHHYLIYTDFPVMLNENNGNYTATYSDLGVRYNLNSGSVKRIISKTKF